MLPPTFFKFARETCPNYSRTGPNQQTHYCWLDGCTCNLYPEIDMGCFYFINVVLPLDKDLESQWLSLHEPRQGSTTDLKQSQSIPNKSGTFRVCACGKEFPATSNRQRKCKDCRRESTKQRVRKHRAKKAQSALLKSGKCLNHAGPKSVTGQN